MGLKKLLSGVKWKHSLIYWTKLAEFEGLMFAYLFKAYITKNVEI